MWHTGLLLLVSLCSGQLLPSSPIHFYDSVVALSTRIPEKNLLVIFEQLEYLTNIHSNLTSRCEFHGTSSTDAKNAKARYEVISSEYPQILTTLKEKTNVFLKTVKAATITTDDNRLGEQAKEALHALTGTTTESSSSDDDEQDISLEFRKGEEDFFETGISHPKSAVVYKFFNGKATKEMIKLNKGEILDINANFFSFYKLYEELRKHYQVLFDHVGDHLYSQDGVFSQGVTHSKICEDFLTGLQHAVSMGIRYIKGFNKIAQGLLESGELPAGTFDPSKYESVTTKLVQKGITKKFFSDGFDGLVPYRFDLNVYSHEGHIYFRLKVPRITHSLKLHSVGGIPMHTKIFGRNFLTHITSPFENFLAFKLGSFVPLTAKELDQCLNVHGEYYCKRNLVYHSAQTLLESGYCSAAMFLKNVEYMKRNCVVKIHPIEFSVKQLEGNIYKISSQKSFNVQGFTLDQDSVCGRETNSPRLFTIDKRVANLILTVKDSSSSSSESSPSSSSQSSTCELFNGENTVTERCHHANCLVSTEFTLSHDNNNAIPSDTHREILKFTRFVETKLSTIFSKGEIYKNLIMKNGHFSPFESIHPSFEETSIRSYTYYLLVIISFIILSIIYAVMRNSLCKIYEVILLRRNSSEDSMWRQYVRGKANGEEAPPPFETVGMVNQTLEAPTLASQRNYSF